MGFVVDDVMECAERIEAAGANRLTPLDPEVRRRPPRGVPETRNAEAKLGDPEGVSIDISEFGLAGNSL